MTILQIQQALKDAGFDPGPIDGIMGSVTRSAIRAFQQSKGLTADGIVGPVTSTALTGNAPPTLSDNVIPLDLPWMVQAARFRGTTEIPGPEHNPRIMGWAEDLDLPYSSDEVAWCGLYTAHCITSQLPDEPIPNNPLGARNWKSFGIDVSNKPQFGSVLVFWRVHPTTSWKGHVGFYWAEDDTHYHVLGGNQSNGVNIARLKKNRLLKARWPTAVEPKNLVRVATPNGILESVNEA